LYSFHSGKEKGQYFVNDQLIVALEEIGIDQD